MHFLVLAWDVAGDSGIALRDSVRPRHTASIRELWEQGHAILGAGIRDDAGVIRGSLVVLDYPTRADVDEYLANEPFMTEGVWDNVEVRELYVGEQYLQPGSQLGPRS